MGYGLEIVSHVVFYVVNTIQTSRYNVVVMMCMCMCMSMRMSMCMCMWIWILKYVLPSKQLPWIRFPVCAIKFGCSNRTLLHFLRLLHSEYSFFQPFFSSQPSQRYNYYQYPHYFISMA